MHFFAGYKEILLIPWILQFLTLNASSATNQWKYDVSDPAHQGWGTEQPLCTADLRSLVLGYTLGKNPQHALTDSEVTLEQLEVHDGPPPKPTSDIRDYLNMFLQWYHHASCILSDDHNKIASFFY